MRKIRVLPVILLVLMSVLLLSSGCRTVARSALKVGILEANCQWQKSSAPALPTSGILELGVDTKESKVGEVVSIYEGATDSTCYWAEFPEALSILKPLPPGWSYTDIGSKDIIASHWSHNGSTLRISANIGNRLDPGVYTAIVWKDEGELLYSTTIAEETFKVLGNL